MELINVKRDRYMFEGIWFRDLFRCKNNIPREIYFYSIIAVFSWHFILCGQINDYFVLFSKIFIWNEICLIKYEMYAIMVKKAEFFSEYAQFCY